MLRYSSYSALLIISQLMGGGIPVQRKIGASTLLSACPYNLCQFIIILYHILVPLFIIININIYTHIHWDIGVYNIPYLRQFLLQRPDFIFSSLMLQQTLTVRVGGTSTYHSYSPQLQLNVYLILGTAQIWHGPITRLFYCTSLATLQHHITSHGTSRKQWPPTWEKQIQNTSAALGPELLSTTLSRSTFCYIPPAEHH